MSIADRPQPRIVDVEEWQRERDALLVREKAHTREGDAIAAARRNLPMVEVENFTLTGKEGPISLLDIFDGRDELVVYKHMWTNGAPFEDQCEGCTLSQYHMHDASYLHHRGVSYAVFADGPWNEVEPFIAFMGYTVPWYSVEGIQNRAVAGEFGAYVAFLRDGEKIYLTGEVTGRGVEMAMVSLKLLDMTVYGRMEQWETSPENWPQPEGAGWFWRKDGRPTYQWTRPGATPVSGREGKNHH